jgi:hypothetical protein
VATRLTLKGQNRVKKNLTNKRSEQLKNWSKLILQLGTKWQNQFRESATVICLMEQRDLKMKTAV